MKIISLFNHKGGVSKTTTAFNLGWMLATLGYKTLLVDADPQCNLTAMVLDYNSVEDIEKFYQSNQNCDIYSGIEPAINGTFEKLKAIEPVKTQNENLYLMAGNIKLSEAETQISVALTASNAIPAIRNIPGSFRGLIKETCDKYDFNYIIIDMSPSVGAMNECLLMSSDYFIVPTFPDFFCTQAIKSLSSVIPRWNEEINPFRRKELTYSLNEKPPKFIGIISQKYRPRSGAPAKSFQRWIDSIKSTVQDELIPVLTSLNMTVDKETFIKFVSADTPYNLSNISDFNSLIAQSQKHNVPIFALTDEQIEQGGVVLENMKKSREEFKKVFQELAQNIIDITNNI